MQAQDISVSQIRPNPDQPRKFFDESKLKELADSIKGKGLLEEILVRPKDEHFEIVHGERRWRACKLLGLKTIRAKVESFADDEAFELSLIENIQRENLLPIEEARAYKVFVDKGLTHEEIAGKVNKTRTYITQKLRILKLPNCINWLLEENGLSEGQMRQLLRLEDIIRPHLNREKADPRLWFKGNGRIDDWVEEYQDYFACRFRWKSVSDLKDAIDKFYFDICSAMLFSLGRDIDRFRIPSNEELGYIIKKQNAGEALTEQEMNLWCSWFEDGLVKKMGLDLGTYNERDSAFWRVYSRKIGFIVPEPGYSDDDKDIENNIEE